MYGPVTQCDELEHFADFEGSRSIADHRSLSQVSPSKLQQCGQLTTLDGMFL